MKKSAYYSDLIFTFSLVFFCVLFPLRYQRIPLFWALILSAFVAGFGAYLLSLRLRKKQKIFALKKSEELEKNDFMFYLCLISKQDQTEFLRPRLPFLLRLLADDNVDQAEEEDSATEATNEKILRLGEYAFLPFFKFQALTEDDIALAFTELKQEQTPVLLCNKLSPEGKLLVEKLSMQVLLGEEIYRAFKDNYAIPEEFPVKARNPVKQKRRSIFFSKSNSRRFFLCGVTLLFSSVFIPYPIYYLTVGIFLLSLSLLVRIFG